MARFHAHSQHSDFGPDLEKSSCVTTICSHQHILVQLGASLIQLPRKQEGLSSWQQFQNSQFTRVWKLEVEESGEAQEIVKVIENGTAIAVSNGTFKPGRGAAAWTIEGGTANDKIMGACLVPGTGEDHSAFHSELMGLLGILLTVHYLLEEVAGGSGFLRVCCDGQLALGRAVADQPIIITEPHMDLISAIRKVKEGLKCKLIFKHVRGHQDAGQATALERDATLNVEMDLRAKAKLADTARPGSPEVPFEGWMSYIGPRKIIKQWQLTLREHINGNVLCNHWQHKRRFGRGESEQVDWTSVRQAMTEVRWNRQKWVTKFTSGEFAHGVNMQR